MDNTQPKPGLYQKFNVDRIIGTDKEGEEFFVLSPTHDPMAREALRLYADIASINGLNDLANDLIDALDRVDAGDTFYPSQEKKELEDSRPGILKNYPPGWAEREALAMIKDPNYKPELPPQYRKTPPPTAEQRAAAQYKDRGFD